MYNNIYILNKSTYLIIEEQKKPQTCVNIFHDDNKVYEILLRNILLFYRL